MDKKEIKYEMVWKVIESRVGEKTFLTAVNRWNDGRPKLEKREQYIDKATGETRLGKCAGFDDEDFQLLIQQQERISSYLTHERKAR